MVKSENWFQNRNWVVRTALYFSSESLNSSPPIYPVGIMVWPAAPPRGSCVRPAWLFPGTIALDSPGPFQAQQTQPVPTAQVFINTKTQFGKLVNLVNWGNGPFNNWQMGFWQVGPTALVLGEGNYLRLQETTMHLIQHFDIYSLHSPMLLQSLQNSRTSPHSLREGQWFRCRPGEIASDKRSYLQVSFKHKVKRKWLARLCL